MLTVIHVYMWARAGTCEWIPKGGAIMASDVDDILAAVRSLPTQEQREILRRLAESLAGNALPIERAANDFWMSHSIDDLARDQQVSPVADIRALALPDWPGDESADEIIGYIYAQRHTDRKA